MTRNHCARSRRLPHCRSPRDPKDHLFLVAALTVAVLALGVGRAEAESVKCKREIARASSKFVQARIKATTRCEDQVLTGNFAGPCPDDKAASQIAKAAAKLRSAVDTKCGGADRSCGSGGDDDALATIGFAGSCPNFENGGCNGAFADCDDVGDCVACIDEAALDQVVDLALGAPGASADARACQREIAKSLAGIVRGQAKARAVCTDRVLNGLGGSCPDTSTAARITKERLKFTQKVCTRCGGADRACGGGDDLAPAAIGLGASCPAVTVPGGAACGGAITDLASAVACLACVSEFKSACTAAAAAPAAGAYPAECNFGVANPTATPTPNGGGATSTVTPDGGPTTTPGAGATATATPGAAATATTTPGGAATATTTAGAAATATVTPGAGGPTATPTPGSGGPCTLPNPLPEVVSFQARPGSELDTGWTGVAHDTSTVDDALIAAARLEGCDVNPSSPTCGECQLAGPVAFPGPAKNCVCFNLATTDASSLAACDPEAGASCGAGESCECFLGPPLPISSGGVPVCVINRLTGPVTGTANIADSGPHAGEGAVAIQLNAGVFNGVAVEQPCPVCNGDPTPRDGVKGGTCSGGLHDGDPCDVGGTSPFFGSLSLDCGPTSVSSIGNLRIAFDPATTGTTQLGKVRPCTNGNGGNCFCDTCATAAAEPCNSNADCAGGVVCGGRRCIGGPNAGAQCNNASQCPGGGFCNRPGQPTAANDCIDSVCSPNPSDGPNEGICEAGPVDSGCSLESFRGCTTDQDCNPPPSGNCPSCVAGQACLTSSRQCFLETIVREGAPGTQTAVVAATFCIPPTSSQSVNQVAGLPGPGALELPTRIFRSGAQCGNGILNAGEACDGAVDDACPGLCQPDCTCAGCGNGVVDAGEQCDGGDDALCPGQCSASCQCPAASCGNGNQEAGEQCDGSDAAACPGACQTDCTCGAVCGNDLVEDGEECDGSGSEACPAAACQSDCTCGSFCGDGAVDPGEECDGSGAGLCPGTCQADCQCSPICGDDQRQAGELCDGTDDALCPGQCTEGCTCPGQGELTLVVQPGADLDTGWTGTAHDSAVQTGSTIRGELSGCNGSTDVDCDFFGNVGSFCSADPSRACLNNNDCSGAGTCVIQTFGPPLPLSAGGVPACIVNRFASDATGTYNTATGATAINLRLSSLVHLGAAVSAPCPTCDCGKPNLQDCQVGESGTCTGILGSPACTVGGNGPFGPTSNDCPPSSSLNVSGAGLDIPFTPATTGTVTFPSNQPCDGSGFQGQSCWCDGETQPSQCQRACDGGGNDGQSCTSDAECPGAPAGACKPLCRQITGEAVGEGECVAGPISQTCGGAPEIGCQNNSDCPAGKGPCVSDNQRCFLDPIVKTGTAGITTNTLVSAFCIPATSGTAINQTAGLPGPGTIAFPNAVTAAICGDGVKNRTAEECDGSDDDNCPGACLANCTCNTSCGNGIIEFGEQCDGSNAPACPGQCALPGTPAECTCPPVCGDGFIGAGEQCDPGGVGGTPPASDAQCPGLCSTTNCQCTVTLPQCGNGTVDAGEACDLPAAGCGPLQVCLLCNQCFPPPDVIPPELGFICGNGNIEPTEVCELPARGCGDGEICQPVTCDACTPLLPGPLCGNLNIETGEVCELPSIGCGPGELCVLCGQCIPFLPICGNLNLEPGEACELPALGCGPLQACLLCQQCVP